MPGIFISYRRDDSSGHVGRLAEQLSRRFGKDRVFMDLDTIRPGDDFVVQIRRAVSSCRALLVVIGKDWLTATGPDGRRRLDDPDDFVRAELTIALQQQIAIIPVLVQGAGMPRSDELPEPLRPLVRRQAIELTDQRWAYDVAQLTDALQPILGADRWTRLPRGRIGRGLALMGALIVMVAVALVLVQRRSPGEPSPTATTAGVRPSEMTRLLFSDDLSKQSAGWPMLNRDPCFQSFAHDAFRFRITQKNKFCKSDSAFNPDITSLPMVRVEVDATWRELPPAEAKGEATASFGLRCYANGGGTSGDAYDVRLDDNGHYSFVRYQGGQYQIMKDRISKSLQTGPGLTRRLRLECSPADTANQVMLKLYVDGRLIDTYVDRAGLAKGLVGMEVSNWIDKPVEAEFRNFAVYTSP
jgi:TIR domain